MNHDLPRLAEELKDYLRGAKRADAEQLVQLTEFGSWQRFAQVEADRRHTERATRLLELLDDEVLAAVASGDINVQAGIREVLAEAR